MRYVKIFFVILGALGVTALGIDAADTVTGSRLTLLASLMGTREIALCPVGMTPLKDEVRTMCVDMYEAGVGNKCAISEPLSVQDTLKNLERTECKPVSAPQVLPWRFVSYRLAEQLCARAGKTLLSVASWYKAALGTPDTVACASNEQSLSKTGSHSSCVSGIGAFDMIGNVWELVAGEVKAGKLADQTLPHEGYVSAVGDNGIPTETDPTPNALYGSDYFWTEAFGTYAVMRGGFYKGQSDAGLYSTQAAISDNFSGEAVGFRCGMIL